MGTLRNFGKLIVLMCFFIAYIQETDGLRTRKISSGAPARKCVDHMICNCGYTDNFQECYERLVNKTRHWLLEKVNECELGPDKLGDHMKFPEMSKIICAFDPKEWEDCYEKVNDQVKNYNIELAISLDPGRQEERMALEQGKVCVTPNLLKCSEYGVSC